jgi:hypothetical protein
VGRAIGVADQKYVPGLEEFMEEIRSKLLIEHSNPKGSGFCVYGVKPGKEAIPQNIERICVDDNDAPIEFLFDVGVPTAQDQILYIKNTLSYHIRVDPYRVRVVCRGSEAFYIYNTAHPDGFALAFRHIDEVLTRMDLQTHPPSVDFRNLYDPRIVWLEKDQAGNDVLKGILGFK